MDGACRLRSLSVTELHRPMPFGAKPEVIIQQRQPLGRQRYVPELQGLTEAVPFHILAKAPTSAGVKRKGVD